MKKNIKKSDINFKIKNLIKKPYYYVPPCPVCHSDMTGHYVLAQNHRKNDIEWMINDSLKNGELIKLVNRIDEQNCFCVICQTEWYSDISMQFKSLNYIEKEKEKRHTEEILEDRLSEVKKAKAKGLIGLFINFVGKL